MGPNLLVHTFPQVPQLDGDWLVSAQTPLQQAFPAGQACPTEPQLSGSVRVLFALVRLPAPS